MRRRYSLALADPPWLYDNKQQNDPARGGIQYPSMTMKELHDIPIYKAMEDNSLLVCWVTMPKLVDSFYAGKEKVGGKVNKGIYNPLSIMHAWGFRPVTVLFTWVKLNRKAFIDCIDTGADYEDIIWKKDFYSGMGNYTNSNVEVAIVARRGKGLKRLTKNVKQLIIAPIGKHSAKPREQYQRLFSLYGDVPRIELFARDVNPPPTGWDAVGLEYTPAQDIRDWIKGYDV